MITLGPILLFRLRTIWETVDEKFYPTRLIAQTLPVLTTICSGRCRTPSLEYGSHQKKFEFFDDFERQKHALSIGPVHKALRSKVTEI